MTAIIDYGAGNLQSVEKALRHIGCDCQVTADPAALLASKAAVLPGVGAFGDAMRSLRARGLEEPIRAFIASGKPFLGICLGLQLLFESSEESPGVAGLGLLKGKILRLPAESGLKIPHLGWNSLTIRKPGGLFAGVEGGALRVLRPLLLPPGGGGRGGRHRRVRGRHPRRGAEGQPAGLPVPPGKERGGRP